MVRPSGRLRERMRQMFGHGDAAPADLASLIARLEMIEHTTAEVVQAVQQRQPDPSPEPRGLTAIQEALAALEKQVNRAGREQLRTSSLVDAQMEQAREALELIRTIEARRETEMTALRDQQRAAIAAGRLEVVRALLPAIDGLDEALRSGQHLLDQPVAQQPRNLWARLFGPAARMQEVEPLRQGMEAWLAGLHFVRKRLLDVLAAEGVQPMDGAGQRFDPQWHIAQQLVPATKQLPPGTIAAMLRQGYRLGDRVLRHAEVAVTQDEMPDGLRPT